jgi:hypothetical protein
VTLSVARADAATYKRCDTFTLRGGFILNKLLQRNPARLVYVMENLYRSEPKDPRELLAPSGRSS